MVMVWGMFWGVEDKSVNHEKVSLWKVIYFTKINLYQVLLYLGSFGFVLRASPKIPYPK